MKPTVRVFTRAAPCTKAEIWTCFATVGGLRSVPVAEAQAIIGANVPRVMEARGRLVVTERMGVEYYSLTTEGKEWLIAGIERYCKNHPAEKAKLPHLPPWGAESKLERAVRIRRPV